MNISEAVEGAMRASYRRDTWDDENARRFIARAITAAAPYLIAQAWDEGFDRGFYDPLAGSDRDASESPAKNPYRSGT